MIFWVVLMAFALPLIKYLFSLRDDKKRDQRALMKIQQHLKEIEKRNKKKRIRSSG